MTVHGHAYNIYEMLLVKTLVPVALYIYKKTITYHWYFEFSIRVPLYRSINHYIDTNLEAARYTYTYT